jgi:hypothetical protein
MKNISNIRSVYSIIRKLGNKEQAQNQTMNFHFHLKIQTFNFQLFNNL